MVGDKSTTSSEQRGAALLEEIEIGSQATRCLLEIGSRLIERER